MGTTWDAQWMKLRDHKIPEVLKYKDYFDGKIKFGSAKEKDNEEEDLVLIGDNDDDDDEPPQPSGKPGVPMTITTYTHQICKPALESHYHSKKNPLSADATFSVIFLHDPSKMDELPEMKKMMTKNAKVFIQCNTPQSLLDAAGKAKKSGLRVLEVIYVDLSHWLLMPLLQRDSTQLVNNIFPIVVCARDTYTAKPQAITFWKHLPKMRVTKSRSKKEPAEGKKQRKKRKGETAEKPPPNVWTPDLLLKSERHKWKVTYTDKQLPDDMVILPVDIVLALLQCFATNEGHLLEVPELGGTTFAAAAAAGLVWHGISHSSACRREFFEENFMIFLFNTAETITPQCILPLALECCSKAQKKLAQEISKEMTVQGIAFKKKVSEISTDSDVDLLQESDEDAGSQSSRSEISPAKTKSPKQKSKVVISESERSRDLDDDDDE